MRFCGWILIIQDAVYVCMCVAKGQVLVHLKILQVATN